MKVTFTNVSYELKKTPQPTLIIFFKLFRQLGELSELKTNKP